MPPSPRQDADSKWSLKLLPPATEALQYTIGGPRHQMPSARWYQVPGLTLHGFCTYLAPFYPPSLIIGSGSWRAWRIFIKIWPVGRHCAAHQISRCERQRKAIKGRDCPRGVSNCQNFTRHTADRLDICCHSFRKLCLFLRLKNNREWFWQQRMIVAQKQQRMMVI